MKIYDDPVIEVNEHNISGIRPMLPDGCVLTVGSFDGVHLGHRALLSELKNASVRRNVSAAVLTFSSADRPKSSLSLAEPEKVFDILRQCGADFVFVLPFGGVKGYSARDFTEQYVQAVFNAKEFVCGYDFRFGSDLAGREAFAGILEGYGIPLTVCDPVLSGGYPVSSTRIRALVSEGGIAEANALLGSAFSFRGRVIYGERIASALGFPTANIPFPKGLVPPAYGVYAATLSFGGEVHKGMLNFGVKPTFGGVNDPVCEVNIFGFSGTIYGEEAEVSFLDFIRPEEKFASPDELRARIIKDRESVEKYFEERVKTDE